MPPAPSAPASPAPSEPPTGGKTPGATPGTSGPEANPSAPKVPENDVVPVPETVTVKRGDSLWRISRRVYGRGIHWKAIFAANRDRIRHPHWIFIGQVLVIPKPDPSWK